ncbi:MAG: YggT family protein [Geobacter sp.]|nr:YggT family protein [Geobacter sp.]
MFILANFLTAVATILNTLLTIYMYIIIARAVISWVNADPYNPIVNFLYKATEPVLYRVRRVLPDMGGIDLSPLLVLLAIFFLQKFAVSSIYDLAFRLKMGMGAGGITP